MITSEKYIEDKLCDVLYNANNKETPLELIKRDNFYVDYIKDYLSENNGLNAKFFVSDPEYISVDYLTDYSYYYSKSYKDYNKKCVRLHFFSYKNDDKNQFDNELIMSIIKGNKDQETNFFWDNYYLGFIVIRPIPVFLIGYTLLKHYNFTNNNKYKESRNLWAVKDYSIHIFGSKVKINSLAFMSQDSNVAACATIAIWCAYQIAVENHYTNLKSPYQITFDSGSTITDGNRIFPNNGLDPVAICKAITKNNLATEIRYFEKNPKNINLKLKKYTFAYSKMKIPLILGLFVPNNDVLYPHAVAICGYNIDNNFDYHSKTIKSNLLCQKNGLRIIHTPEAINQIYIHDDQWGPFAKCIFTANDELVTSWTSFTKEKKNSKPIALIIPVQKKIRIPYEDIEEDLVGIDSFMKMILEKEIKGGLRWDIQINFSTEFKSDVQSSNLFNINDEIEKGILIRFLEKPLPKYIWILTLFINNNKILHFIYDATGLRHTNNLISVLCYYPTFISKLKSNLKLYETKINGNSEQHSYFEISLGDTLQDFLNKINIYH